MSNDLRELIAGTKGERSYEALSRDCGGAPTSKRLHQLATTTLKNFPDPLTIQGLARGLGVSVTEVVLASARSLGLPVRDLGDVASIDPTGLTDEQADAVRHVVRAFRGSGQEATDGTATKQAGGAGQNVHALPTPPTVEEFQSGQAAAFRRRPRRPKDG